MGGVSGISGNCNTFKEMLLCNKAHPDQDLMFQSAFFSESSLLGHAFTNLNKLSLIVKCYQYIILYIIY